MSQHAALQESVELVHYEMPQVSAGLGQREDRRGVLLHPAGLPSAFRAVALLVDRGAVGRPLGLPAEARLPKDFHGGSWDAHSKGMLGEAERFLAGVEGLRSASIGARLSRALQGTSTLKSGLRAPLSRCFR